MINIENTGVAIPEELKVLQDAPCTFYLTGSRAGLNIVRGDSDWDFFVQDQPEVRAWLFKNGFYRIGGSYNDDPQVVQVYRGYAGNTDLNDPWRAYGKTNIAIDIQVVEDVLTKRFIQKIMRQTEAVHGLSKLQARRVWRAVYEAVTMAPYMVEDMAFKGLEFHDVSIPSDYETFVEHGE